MKILIGGIPEMTFAYQNALSSLGVSFAVSLEPTFLNFYDGLLLPGGNDIHPSFWNEEITFSRKIDYPVDLQQFALLDFFVQKKMPVFGICKGMQLINVYYGGSIHQHLKEASCHEYRSKDQVHLSYTPSENILTKLYGHSFSINSAHHQGIHTLGNHLTALQYADDGVVEGIAHTTLPIIGVQWHPERMCCSYARKDTVDGSLLLNSFLELCC